jgi:cytochrome c peroxidase
VKNTITYLFLAAFGAFVLFACEKSSPQVTTEFYPLDKLPIYFGSYKIPADNPLTYKGIELGRMLFYEKQLSADNSISCGSCHQQKLAFSDGLAQSVGFQGRKREVGSMSLSNLLWQNHFNWTGNANTLEEQVLMPMQHIAEMNQPLNVTISKLQSTANASQNYPINYPQKFLEVFGSSEITETKIAKALSQFLRTLISDNSKFDKSLRGELQLTAQEQRGRNLLQHPYPLSNIRGGNCLDCHTNLLFSGSNLGFDGFRNNGLDDDANLKDGLATITKNSFDKGKFKVPTLRNIALTAPYMHDGRFKTLEEVLDHYNDHIKFSQTLDPLILEATNELFPPQGQVKLGLTTQEKEDIIAFLKTLTDEKFISNPSFANPF